MAAYEAVVSGRLAHDGDPVLARHIRACQAVNARDGAGQRLSKRRPGKKIAASIAMVMAVGEAMGAVEEGYIEPWIGSARV